MTSNYSGIQYLTLRYVTHTREHKHTVERDDRRGEGETNQTGTTEEMGEAGGREGKGRSVGGVGAGAGRPAGRCEMRNGQHSKIAEQRTRNDQERRETLQDV